MVSWWEGALGCRRSPRDTLRPVGYAHRVRVEFEGMERHEPTPSFEDSTPPNHNIVLVTSHNRESLFFCATEIALVCERFAIVCTTTR